MEKKLVELLIEKKLVISSCESCTGGLVAKRITEVPGASGVFEFGAVTYANGFKNKIAGVSFDTLEKYGAVSRECAFEMAKGICEFSGSDIGICTTGIAGPGGGTDEKPVGLVYVGVYSEKGFLITENYFGSEKSREEIRTLASDKALELAVLHIKKYF